RCCTEPETYWADRQDVTRERGPGGCRGLVRVYRRTAGQAVSSSRRRPSSSRPVPPRTSEPASIIAERVGRPVNGSARVALTPLTCVVGAVVGVLVGVFVGGRTCLTPSTFTQFFA